MTENEKKEFLETQKEAADEMLAKIDSKIEKSLQGLITEDGLMGLKSEIKAEVSEIKVISDETARKFESSFEKINAEIEAIAVETKKLGENKKILGTVKYAGNLRELITKAIEESGITEKYTENGVELERVNLGSHPVRMQFKFDYKGQTQKAAENIFLAGSGTQSVFSQAINRFIYGETRPPITANDHMLGLLPTKTVSGSYMTGIIYENYEDNSSIVAEGAAPSADSRLEVTSIDYKVFTVSATATASKDLLRDKMELIDELVFQLRDSLEGVLDSNILQNSGDNSATPYGAFNSTYSCNVFNPLIYTGTVVNPTIVDVIAKAKLDVRLLNFNADTVIANPINYEEIEGYKASDYNSVMDRRIAYSDFNVEKIVGLEKVQTTKVGTNAIYIATKGAHDIGLRQDIEVEFGHNTDDLKKRKVSMVMDMRFGYGVRNKNANVYVDDLATSISILGENAAASLVRVQAYATGSDAGALTIATLTNTGATSVIDANLAAYKVAIAAESSIANLAALQVVVDAVNAA